MNSIFEKEKKLNDALKKLNHLNPVNSDLKDTITNLDHQKNQLEIEKKRIRGKI